jgi:hypothetical protein
MKNRTVRRGCCTWIFVLILGVLASAHQQKEGSPPTGRFQGTWTVTEGGSGKGGFEITITKDKDGALGGSVSIKGEPAYTANLKSIAFDGAKMTAMYDFPLDARLEVLLDATFEGTTATGTWLVREKESTNEVGRGTWTVRKRN